MARRKTSVIQVMITGDASDLNKATQSGSQGMGLLGAAAITAAKVMASALSGIAAFSIREFARFDNAMTQSQAIMGNLSDTTKKAMSDVAREVGVNTTFAAHEAAEAFYFLASAGLDAEQSMAALPRVATFAQAGMFDLARATDILTDVQSALGMSSDDAGESLAAMTELSNTMVGAATLANASVEQFGEAFMRAGARIRMVGVPLNEASAVLGAFADQGVKGAAGGEALNIILRDLPRAANRNAKAFRDLGIRVEEADGTFRPMADIIEDFEGALDGLSATQQAGVFTTLGLTRSVADQLSVLVGTSDQIRKYQEDLELMGDVTQEVADKQLQSFTNQIALTRAQFTNIGLTIGEALSGPLRQFNLWLREQTPAIKAFVEEAIPKIEEFAQKAVAKFREFREAFQTNVREPIEAFLRLPATVAFFAEFEAEFERFTERLRNLGRDLRSAVDEEDPNAIGLVLGEFVAEIFRTAFGRAEVIGDAIKEAFGGLEWKEIGVVAGGVAVEFFKGFFEGLFAQPKIAEGELEAGTKTITSMLTDNFVSTIIGAAILSKVPLVGGIFRALFFPFKLAFGLLATKLITPIGGSLILGGLWGAIKLAFLGIFGLIKGSAMVLAAFVFIPMADALRFAVGKLGALLAPAWQRLLIVVRGQFSRWAFRFTGVAGATITRAIGLLAVAGVKALAKAVGAFVLAIFGWPALLIGAAIAAIAAFIVLFRRWFNRQDTEFENIGSAIVTFIAEGVIKLARWFNDTILGWFRDRFNAFETAVEGFRGDYESLGSAIIDGMIRGITSKGAALRDALVGAARRAWDATKNFLGISSPSKLFITVGENMMDGLAKGIDDSARIVQAAVGSNSAMAANEARRFAEMAAAQRVSSQQPAGQSIVVNVTGGMMDPEGVAREVVKVLNDSQRRAGAGGAALFI